MGSKITVGFNVFIYKKKVPVWAVLDYTKTKLVERELLLIKVSILGPEHLHEQLPTAKFDEDVEFEDEIVSRYENVSYKCEWGG